MAAEHMLLDQAVHGHSPVRRTRCVALSVKTCLPVYLFSLLPKTNTKQRIHTVRPWCKPWTPPPMTWLRFRAGSRRQ